MIVVDNLTKRYRHRCAMSAFCSRHAPSTPDAQRTIVSSHRRKRRGFLAPV